MAEPRLLPPEPDDGTLLYCGSDGPVLERDDRAARERAALYTVDGVGPLPEIDHWWDTGDYEGAPMSWRVAVEDCGAHRATRLYRADDPAVIVLNGQTPDPPCFWVSRTTAEHVGIAMYTRRDVLIGETALTVAETRTLAVALLAATRSTP